MIVINNYTTTEQLYNRHILVACVIEIGTVFCYQSQSKNENWMKYFWSIFFFNNLPPI